MDNIQSSNQQKILIDNKHVIKPFSSVKKQAKTKTDREQKQARGLVKLQGTYINIE